MKKHIERLKRIKHGNCDFCGEYSVMIIDGACQKVGCQRFLKHEKAAKHG